MALSTEDRQRVARGLERHWSRFWETVSGCTSGDVLAAVVATDTWIENNQAGYNSALPDAARTGLTAPQKTVLFCAVALARVSLAFLRQVFGGVD